MRFSCTSLTPLQSIIRLASLMCLWYMCWMWTIFCTAFAIPPTFLSIQVETICTKPFDEDMKRSTWYTYMIILVAIQAWFLVISSSENTSLRPAASAETSNESQEGPLKLVFGWLLHSLAITQRRSRMVAINLRKPGYFIFDFTLSLQYQYGR